MEHTRIETVRELPPSEARAVAGIMLELHAEFRRRHGLPQLPSVWSVGEHLRALGARAMLTDPVIARSRTPVIGPALTVVRRVFRELLKPFFHRQSEINRDLVLALEALAREREQGRHAHYVLTERVAELEAVVGRLRARVE